MDIYRLVTTNLETNTYLVGNAGRGFVVDPGGKANEIARIAHDKCIEIDAILLTHGHFDHIGGVAALLNLLKNEIKVEGEADASYNNAPSVFIHKGDEDKIGTFKSLGFISGHRVEKFVPDVLLVGGEELSVGGIKVKVISTPGHSKGGVCYVVGDVIFSGDTLFNLSYGRTDFYDGSFDELKNSVLNKLFNLEGDFKILPGHGEASTLDIERACNPIITDSRRR